MNNNFDDIIKKYTTKLSKYKMQILNNLDDKKEEKIIKKFEKMFYGKISVKKEDDFFRISNKSFYWEDFIDDISNGLLPKFRNLKLLFELEYSGNILYVCFFSQIQVFCIEIELGKYPKYYYKNLDK